MRDIHEALTKNCLVLDTLVSEGYFAETPKSPDCYQVVRDYCSLIPVLEFRFTAEIQNLTMALRSWNMKKVMFLKQKKNILLQMHVSTEHNILTKPEARNRKHAEIQTKSRMIEFSHCENLHRNEALTSL